MRSRVGSFPTFVTLFLSLLMLPFTPLALKWLFTIVAFIYSQRFSRNQDNRLYIKWICTFIFFTLISVLWAKDWKVSLWIIRSMMPIYVLLYSITKYIKTENHIEAILTSYVYASFIIFVYALLFVDFSNLEGSRLGRDVEGDGINSNYLGRYLSIAVYIIYILFRIKALGVFKSIFLFLYSASAICIIFISGSRSSLVLLLVPIVVIYLRANKNILKSLLFIFIILFVVYLAIMKIPLLYSVMGYRMEELFSIITGNSNGTEDGSRFILMLEGLEYAKDAPCLGYGINNYRVLSNSLSVYAGMNFYAHCNYVELLVDIGILGLIIYYSIFFKLFRNANKVKNKYSFIIIPLLIMILFIDIAAVSYYDPAIQFLLCLCFNMSKLNYIYENS